MLPPDASVRSLSFGRDPHETRRWLGFGGVLTVTLVVVTVVAVFAPGFGGPRAWQLSFAGGAILAFGAASYSAYRNDGWLVCLALVLSPVLAFLLGVSGLGTLLGGVVTDTPGLVVYGYMLLYAVVAGTVAFVGGVGLRRLSA